MRQQMIGCVAIAAVAVGSEGGVVSPCRGETCVTHPDGPTVCMSWDASGDPRHPEDFEVSYDDPAYPNVQLKTGALWTVRSVDTENPFDAGDIGTISSPFSDSFDVRLGTGVFDPGARDVQNIILDPQGRGSDAHHSSVAGGYLTGDLTGDLVLQQSDRGERGDCSLVIAGDMEGELWIPVVKVLQIRGRSHAAIHVGDIAEDGNLVVGHLLGQGCAAQPVVTGPITIDAIRRGGAFFIMGNLGADVTVTERIEGSSFFAVQAGVRDVTVALPQLGGEDDIPTIVDFGIEINSAGQRCPFEGDLLLRGGVGEGSFVAVYGALDAGATVDLNGRGVADALLLFEGGEGAIVNGGPVTETGSVRLAVGAGHAFSGTAEFGGVDAGGIIQTTNGVGFAGALNLSGPVGGTVRMSGDLDGSIRIQADVLTGGDIEVVGDVTGEIGVFGDVRGRVHVGGLAGSADGRSGGGVHIDGVVNGPVTVDRATGAGSLIQVAGGLGRNGSVHVNAGGADFNADGDIRIGAAMPFPPLPNVDFYGCIQINGNGMEGFGDLNGEIAVVGCLTGDNPLSICVDGLTNGAVTLLQAGCHNVVKVDGTCPACP